MHHQSNSFRKSRFKGGKVIRVHGDQVVSEMKSRGIPEQRQIPESIVLLVKSFIVCLRSKRDIGLNCFSEYVKGCLRSKSVSGTEDLTPRSLQYRLERRSISRLQPHCVATWIAYCSPKVVRVEAPWHLQNHRCSRRPSKIAV